MDGSRQGAPCPFNHSSRMQRSEEVRTAEEKARLIRWDAGEGNGHKRARRRADEQNKMELSGADRVWVKQSECLEREKLPHSESERERAPRPLSCHAQTVSSVSILYCKGVRFELVNDR